jgi:hypothetical protein
MLTVVQTGRAARLRRRLRAARLGGGKRKRQPGLAATEDVNLGATPVVFDVTFLIPHAARSPRIDDARSAQMPRLEADVVTKRSVR